MPNDDPVENKFDVLVEAIKKLVRLFSLRMCLLFSWL
jgi:hypothetical protein